jgi:AraC-like DNA-binding protein
MELKDALYSALRFNFLYVDRYVFRSSWVYPRSYIPYNMVRYILKGDAVFTLDDKQYTVHEGQIVYIPAGCMLECCALGDYFEFISIRFSVSSQMQAGDFLTGYFHVQTVTDASRDPEILGYFHEVYRAATGQSSGKMFRVRGNMELIIAWLAEHTPDSFYKESELTEANFTLDELRAREDKTKNRIKQDPRIQVVVEYMIAHPNEKYDSENLSTMANMSSSSLRRLFKEHTGRSPGDFLHEIRMATAARKLLISDDRISSIAYEVGFEDPNYFTRKFKDQFGISPQQYRKNARE